jgi:Type IX secretion system protein PorV
MRGFLRISVAVLVAVVTFCSSGLGQGGGSSINNQIKYSTAVPFLTIAPDARSAGMGDVGVATAPDAASLYWNPAKLAFIDNDFGGSISYTPWLRELVNDMSLSYLTMYSKIREEDAVGLSLRYFDLGDIQFTDEQGNNLQLFNPREFSVNGVYSRMLSEKIGVALGLRFIHSNLTGDFNSTNGNASKPGTTAAADMGFYYKNKYDIGGTPTQISFGATIQNLGPKISYSNNNQSYFIPTTLRLGTSIVGDLDVYNKLGFNLDIGKLLVPPYSDPSDQTSVIEGIGRSFSEGTISDLMIGLGVEYNYNSLFFARGGYYYESPENGARQYLTVGIGMSYQVFGLDIAYLIPTTNSQNHPLNNTLRFTLALNFTRSSDVDSVKE